MKDMGPIERRQQTDDNNTYRPFWRLPVIVIVATIGMAVWLLLSHIIPK